MVKTVDTNKRIIEGRPEIPKEINDIFKGRLATKITT